MPRTLRLLLLASALGAANAPAPGAPRRQQQQESAAPAAAQPAGAAEAYRLGENLLRLYVKETERVEGRYPMPRNSDEETRRPVFEKREAALAPLKARMRAAAERLEAPAESLPGGVTPQQARELADTLRVYASAPGDQSARVYRLAEVTTKARINYKPEPGFTEEARRNNVSGLVRLRAVLAADGRVKNVLVLRGLPDGLTEKCVEAARGIRFTPAAIDGRPVSQFILLEYNFN